jgi:hypothetical protein
MTAQDVKSQGTDSIRRTAPDLRGPQIISANGTASVHLTLAVCDYEHVREITQGLVRADGITLTPLIFPSIEEITFRFTKSQEWDVSELSFGKYISLTSQGDAPMVAIPVFPSRVHRDSGMGADRRHLCAGLPGGRARRRSHQDSLAAGRRQRARPRGEGGVESSCRHPL